MDPKLLKNQQRYGTGTGIRTVTCQKVGTGTVINYGSGTGTRYDIMYLITFMYGAGTGTGTVTFQ
jgi:hypothetical protein